MVLPLDPMLNIFPPCGAAGCPIEGEVAPKLGAFANAPPKENDDAGAGVGWLLGAPPN